VRDHVARLGHGQVVAPRLHDLVALLHQQRLVVGGAHFVGFDVGQLLLDGVGPVELLSSQSCHTEGAAEVTGSWQRLCRRGNTV